MRDKTDKLIDIVKSSDTNIYLYCYDTKREYSNQRADQNGG